METIRRVRRAWLYARKSAYRGRRKGRGRSVAEQLDVGRKWCSENDVEVAGEFIDDDRSASPGSKPREDYERMFACIADGTIQPGDAIVGWESARINRDLADYVRLRDACAGPGVFWVINGRLFDMRNDHDRLLSAFEALRAEGEVRDLAGRVNRTLAKNAALGRPHSRTLYGYRRIYDSATGDLSEVVVDEQRAEAVRLVFQWVCEHKTEGWMLTELNRRRLPSPSGTIRDRQVAAWLREYRVAAGLNIEAAAQQMGWPDGARLERAEAGRRGVRPDDVARLLHLYNVPQPARDRVMARGEVAPQWRKRNQVTQIITNPAYIGKRASHGEVITDAIWPPIVDEATFRAANLILRGPARVGTRPGATKNMLSGVATCAHVDAVGVVCGGNVSGSTVTRLGYAIYKCDDQQHFGVKAQPVEDYVTLHVVKRFARADAARLFAVHRDDDEQAARIEADLAGWRADLEEATRAAALPRSDPARISVASLAKLEAMIAPQVVAAERRLGQLRVDPLLMDLIRPGEAEVFAEWERMEVSQRQAVLKAVMEVRISPVGRGRRNVPVEEYVQVSWRRPGE
jgi:site-specific DNA recombinase